MGWLKALAEEKRKNELRKQAQGSRTGLTDSKIRADPLRHIKVPDIQIRDTEPTNPSWTKDIKETSLPATPPSEDTAIQTQHKYAVPNQRLLANAEQQLEDLRRQLRISYGLDPDGGQLP
jgi:hypothetical protein